MADAAPDEEEVDAGVVGESGGDGQGVGDHGERERLHAGH